jgi:hypothetical protein
MKPTDITEPVRNAQNEALIKELDKEVNTRIKEGIPLDVSNLASTLIVASKHQADSQHTDNVTSLISAKKKPTTAFIGEFELLAAAVENSERLWYEQTITVKAPESSGSYSIEVVPFLDDETSVNITVEPSGNDNHMIKTLLGAYSGQTIGMSIVCDDVLLLDAEILVSSDANFAEGTGKVLQIERPNHGKLQIRIKTKD